MMKRAVAESKGQRVASRGAGRRASDYVYEQLRRKIVTLELAPGEVVTEADLIELLDCSRTPLREALQRLAQDHLVVAVPRRGVSISDLSMLDFIDLTETIEGLEPYIAGLAAERITDDQLDALTRITREFEQNDKAAGDLGRLAELDWEFHHIIGAASRNRFCAELQDELHSLIMRFAYLGFKRPGAATGALQDHLPIIDALRARDREATIGALRHHHEQGRERMRAAL